MTQGNNKLHFWYDAQNRPAIVEFNGTKYGYLYNLQGDVIGLIDSANTEVVKYTYDAWGKPLCIRVKHRLHKGQRAQSRERWRFAEQIQPDLDCGKKAVQWEGAVRQALPNGLGYFYRGTSGPAGFTT